MFDNPDLIACCVIGDGEAETGALAASWQSDKFLNPATDGAVLPILHLNGYKIANPTILARIDREELAEYLRGCGYAPHFVEGDDPARMHQLMAATLDRALDEIQGFQHRAVWRAECAPGVGTAGALPGTVLQAAAGHIVVATGDGALSLLQVQVAGRRALSAAEFLNAQSLTGTRLG